MMKNLRQNVSILVIVICFLGFNFASLIGKAQTKNAKAKPKPTPAKTKKSLTPTPKTAKTKTPPKPEKKSDKPNSSAKTKAEKDNKTKQDKKSVTKTAKTPPKPLKTKTASNAKQKVVKEKADPKPKTAQIAKPTTAKPITTPTPKPVQNQKVIVSVTTGHIRSEPNLNSSAVQNLQLGAILSVWEKNNDWYKVSYAEGQNVYNGWVEKTNVTDFNFAFRDEIYQNIVSRNFKKDAMDFAAAAELFDFLTAAQKEVREEKLLADLNFKRLLTLKAALKAVPNDKARENPYQNFLQANEKEIIYSEPAAEWYVRLDNFWQLHSQYKNLPIGEEIAWQAANNPIAGECEGYINCYLYKLRTTFGEYLNFYPNGKYSQKALTNISDFLQPMATDAKEKKVYYAASDTPDRTEFNTFLNDLRMIISKVPHSEKAQAIKQINQITEGYR
ncbi:MAG: SH3 domain-containing protein [Acidobacteriota bacterium]|nr:SH3 domain-containing protein [Acidobacteriota bacterium]